jgi:hypothetical protein
MKISPVGAELYHPEGQTDMTKLILAFRNFGNAPKVVIVIHFVSYSVVSGIGVKGCEHGALNKIALHKLLMGKVRLRELDCGPSHRLKYIPLSFIPGNLIC